MIFLSFLVCLFSSSQPSQKQLDFRVNNPKNNKNEIVFIFKKQKMELSSDNKSYLLGSPVYYSEKNDFTVVELTPNNKVKDDTIVKTLVNDKICLSHTYNKVQNFKYEFQKGDTVVFNYERGYPYAAVINRKTQKFDNNFLADIKIEKPLEDFEFIMKNRRPRNENENKVYFKELKEYRIKAEKILDSLSNKNLISQSNCEMHKASIKYYEINTNTALFNSVKDEDLRRDDLLYLKVYRYFLSNYVVEKLKLKKQFNRDPMSCNSKIAFDSIAKSTVFSKRVKENLLYAHLVNIAEKNSSADLNVYFKKFQILVNDSSLNEKIKNNYLLDFTALKKEIKVVYLTNLSKDKMTLDNLVSKHKGKVILIDFWASWCGPCRAAMPFSKKLRSEYKNKDVVFIYISIDTDFEKWKNASEKEKLGEPEDNLLAINYPNANFYKELQLKSIPRYMIYDKNGKMVHKNAPSPDSNEIINELDKYLNQ